ncbi:MAG: hypothetical protein M1837_004141 [Sclerophora amabilis]|nr:MAG: hypothetical protein M1837_004141 [Sclerophora amabilis]
MSRPTLIFGGGLLGINFGIAGEINIDELLEYMKTSTTPIGRIDTARLYPVTNPGLSEKLLGDAAASDQGFTVDTKIKVEASRDGRGTLTREAIDASVETSLQTLRVEHVGVLYCHYPDSVTPLEETAAALNHHFKQGHFKQLGLANFSPHQVEKFVQICETRGFVKPTVFQGQYNPLYRRPEQSILPILRKHGISFNAYSPLAGGFLTGKLTYLEDLKGTRFDHGSPMGAVYRKLYDKPPMDLAIRHLHKAIQTYNLENRESAMTMTEVSLRWIVYHSMLGGGDGVILGASTVSQLGDNLRDIEKGPLPRVIAETVNRMWEMVEAEAP